jgi:2-dehydropantoate 2-reductase
LLQNAAAGLMVLANRRAGMFSREDISELTLAYLRECLSVARAEGGAGRRGRAGDSGGF